MGEQFKWNPSSERMLLMFRQAVYTEDTVTLDHLLKQKADLEAKYDDGATPLHVAAAEGKGSTVSWLLGRGAPPAAVDAQGFTALTWACVKGHCDIIDTMLAARANPEEATASGGKTPLSLAAERGHMECVGALLASSAQVATPNGDGSTALMCAAHRAETAVVARLLELQSQVNVCDNEGWTALMFTVNAPVPPSTGSGEDLERKVSIDGVMGRLSTTDLMLLHGADTNAQTPDGLTALIIASGQDRPVAVKRLLDGRATVNLSTAKGQSALLVAAANDLSHVVKVLLAAGAEVNHANAKQDTALSLATRAGRVQVVDLLRKAGATEPKGKKGKKGKK